jgi:peptide/nickel transport system substrate-binding protein
MNDACARGMHFNTTKPPYDKWQTRWALALATDIVDVSMHTADGMLRFAALQVPPIDVLTKTYYKPMEPWLQNMALPDGYKPFDAKTSDRLMAALKAKKVANLPTDPQAIKDIFGVGWWKHDPNEASKLLKSIGFKKDGAGKWLLPDGTPWKISIDAPADFEVLSRQLAQATAASWRQFGVDAQINLLKNVAMDSQIVNGKFTVISGWWPLACAIVPDVFVNMERLHQDQIGPSNGPSPNNPERFSTPEISGLIDQLRETAPDSAEIVPGWTKVIQAATYQMPIINMVGTTKFIPVNTTYWTNYPSAKNPYEGPWWWWSVFKYMLPKIKPSK